MYTHILSTWLRSWIGCPVAFCTFGLRIGRLLGSSDLGKTPAARRAPDPDRGCFADASAVRWGTEVLVDLKRGD